MAIDKKEIKDYLRKTFKDETGDAKQSDRILEEMAKNIKKSKPKRQKPAGGERSRVRDSLGGP